MATQPQHSGPRQQEDACSVLAMRVLGGWLMTTVAAAISDSPQTFQCQSHLVSKQVNLGLYIFICIKIYISIYVSVYIHTYILIASPESVVLSGPESGVKVASLEQKPPATSTWESLGAQQFRPRS